MDILKVLFTQIPHIQPTLFLYKKVIHEYDISRVRCPEALPSSLQLAHLCFALLACSPAHVAYSAYTEVASPVVAPAKNADRMNAYYARLRSLHDALG